METAMSMSTSALKSIGSVPESRFLLLGWGTSNFSSLCQRTFWRVHPCTIRARVHEHLLSVDMSFVCLWSVFSPDW